MTPAPSELSARLLRQWTAEGWTEPGDRVVVACSGGLDSLVLLHLLRFAAAELGLEVEGAHFDHRMRPESAEDAAWVRGLAGAWLIPLRVETAGRAPQSEADARELRYAFLHRIARTDGIRRVLTAHHADDQIETLLFRIARGTGVEGLRGIPRTREPGIARPLLSFSRTDLEAYADMHGIRPRVDPSNSSRRFARNRIRHELIPLLESIHPGARKAVLRLARNSERVAEAMEALLAPRLEAVTLDRTPRGLVLDREGLLDVSLPVRMELLRGAARSVGLWLDETGTATAVEFIRTGSSGRGIELSDGFELTREFDRIRLARREPGGDDEGRDPQQDVPDHVSLEAPDDGETEIDLAGRRFRVSWGRVPARPSSWRRVELAHGRLDFPLELRGWRAGDRTRTDGGHKKLKKLFVERRVPSSERNRIPVIADAEGRIVWISGIHLDPSVAASPGERAWPIGVRDAGID